MKSLCSWSGGKDSCFALMQAIKEGYQPQVLLNVLNEQGKISRSHGIPQEILQQQAKAAGIPIHSISSSWQEYEKNFSNALTHLRKEYELSYAIFGDIDLQPHRYWEEKVCTNAGLTAVLPLWKEDRKQLVLRMLAEDVETIIVSCNEEMGSNYIGEKITAELIDELEKINVDPCGENGEYHTLVTNSPLFATPIQVQVTEKLLHNNYWFAGLSIPFR